MSKRAPFSISSGYLTAVGVIYCITACGWIYLGQVTSNRTKDADLNLRGEVSQLWGSTHKHSPPSIVIPTEQEQPPLRLLAGGSSATADLGLAYRRKGLLWYSTYTVHFDGTYTFTNPGPASAAGELVIPFPAKNNSYDEFAVTLDGEDLPIQINQEGLSDARAAVTLEPGRAHQVRLTYRSRGTDSWNYIFGSGTSRTRNFKLVVTTNFHKVDFAGGTLSPTHKTRIDKGWRLTWRFANLLSAANIGVTMPRRLNPGPLTAEISRFAPVSLAFFLFVIVLVAVIKQVRLHPVHLALLSAAFFSFHLLMAYLVDHVPLLWAFAICSLVSVGLVISYLRLVTGTRFALLWAGGAQLLYLILFSLAFFLEGYTGLTITIFSVVTLFVVMQLTARIDWAAKFSLPDPPAGPGGPSPLDRQPEAIPMEPEAAGIPEGSTVFSRVG